jgi:hypothetical protein
VRVDGREARAGFALTRRIALRSVEEQSQEFRRRFEEEHGGSGKTVGSVSGQGQDWALVGPARRVQNVIFYFSIYCSISDIMCTFRRVISRFLFIHF